MEKWEVCNYRHINVLILFQSYWKNVYTIKCNNIGQNIKLSCHKLGFRPNFYTEMCLFYLTELTKDYVSKYLYVVTLPLYVHNDFDSVYHEILCDKVKAIDIVSNGSKSYVSIFGFWNITQTFKTSKITSWA